MATTFTKYAHTHRRFCDGTMDWDTDTFKLALVGSAYVFSAAHTLFDNGANNGTDPSYNELTAGNGYTAGGVTLTTSISDEKLDANDVIFSALTKTFRGGVLYCAKTANGLTNPVVGYILFNDTPADIVSAGVDFVVSWSALGVFTL